ncbi:hypothetical protein [Paremcibacter congregatus]|uniref:hypothetical protein n=1 Tax=Paremcibacter congregatus TaxID=2043170 RepID=UPI0030EEAC28|tara:strand:- start:3293 stop:3616 length:324 start_codon:yes stop_codon:yes gene_type:complete
MPTSPTKPVSIRLAQGEIELLQARALTLSSTVTAVARHMIRTCLEEGDKRTLARRMMQIERRMAALEQVTQESNRLLLQIKEPTDNLLVMFDALLKTLTTTHKGDLS